MHVQLEHKLTSFVVIVQVVALCNLNNMCVRTDAVLYYLIMHVVLLPAPFGSRDPPKLFRDNAKLTY
jgi:hypothetical protein